MADAKNGGAAAKPNGMFALIHTIGNSNAGDGTPAMAKEEMNVTEMEENMKDPEMQEIMGKWWESCLVLLDSDGNGTLERSLPCSCHLSTTYPFVVDEYVNLYKRLIYGTSCMYGEKAVVGQDIDDLIEEDWKRDSGGLLSMDKDRLCNSIYELAETWAKGEAVDIFVDFLTELHEFVFVRYTEELIRPPKARKKSDKAKQPTPTVEGSPPRQSSAPRKSTAKRKSKTTTAAVPVAPPPPEPPALVRAPSITQIIPIVVPTEPPPPVQQPPEPMEEPAYYSFEVRIQLQERIEACQRQLQPVSNVAEIAWLRCTVREEALRETTVLRQGHIEPYPISASDITTLGERVCNKMVQCIQNAEKGRVNELTLLVEDAEHDVQHFIDVVTGIAQGHDILPYGSRRHVQESSKVTSPRPKKDKRPSKPPSTHQVTYDLPSMKTYCLNVAPSYAAYAKKG
ncbi:Aste57867_11211 [Aphanomyces stellatus]|uniref:Aste57867_11211 protein n=1 Tax=Aphanomyces stellatus TaxID=120398 RepID=A0A485KSA4_9STRA|nr:hypothetical protein As57867_011169 [Aphanomyces stellatus]VFT88077.1 Aste57867_11211 [Aphanomyces stellatus]